MTLNKTKSLIIVAVVYCITILISTVLFFELDISNSIYKILIIDIIATLIVFLSSILFKNSSMYDAFWSVIPPFIVASLMFIMPEANIARQYLIFALVLFWSIRLTTNWAVGWTGMRHEDWRYQRIASKTGKLYWPVSFLGIHLMPTLFVFMGCLPLWYSLGSDQSLNILDAVASLIVIVAVIIEWLSDEQLRKFKRMKNEKPYMDKGLWSIMRHPNYFGEILFWFGLYLFMFSAGGFEGWWTGVGLLFMIILFKFISIPLMERRNLDNKPGYDKYIHEVNALIPIKKIKKP